MIHPRALLPLIGLLAGLLWASSALAVVDESVLIRQRVDALLKRRQKPEPLPVDPPNPFALTSAALGGPALVREPAADGGGLPAAKPDEEVGSATTEELLARLASRLRITGLIRLKDRLHIIINDNPWKEGDSLIVNQGSRVIRLQVLRIQPGQLTLRLDEAELVLRF